MSASSKRHSRGFTLAEMLTVIVIMGLFTTFAVAIIAPVVNAPNKEQAKIDTLQAAGRGLYQMQRDLRTAAGERHGSGYPRVIGPAATRQRLDLVHARALAALQPLGPAGEPLRELAGWALADRPGTLSS